MISTYTLAVEAYDEVRGALPASFAPPEDDVTPTYGGYQTAARRALRDLGYDTSTFPTAPVAIDDDKADDFRNLLNYYVTLQMLAVATASASKIKAGPIEIHQSQYQMVGNLHARYAAQVAGLLGLIVGTMVGDSPLVYDFELDIEERRAGLSDEYGRFWPYDPTRNW